MRQETENPILVVNDSELAAQMQMKAGRFYCYFKPSFINGFEQYEIQNKDQLNFNYLQPLDGNVCRDEFVFKQEMLDEEGGEQKLEELLAKTKGFHTEKFAIQNFDDYFTRSSTVEFLFNPNFADFKRKYKSG